MNPTRLKLTLAYYLIQFIFLFSGLILILVDYFMLYQGKDFFQNVSLKNSREQRMGLQIFIEVVCLSFLICTVFLFHADRAATSHSRSPLSAPNADQAPYNQSGYFQPIVHRAQCQSEIRRSLGAREQGAFGALRGQLGGRTPLPFFGGEYFARICLVCRSTSHRVFQAQREHGLSQENQ